MNLLTPLAIRIGSLSWLPRFLPQITGVDKLLQRVTGDRWSILRIAGLPNVLLTVTGRKSGVPRTTPLLCVPWGDGVLIAGSNFGAPRPPVWVVNVRAATTVHIVRDRAAMTAVPRELSGPERDRAWAQMLRTWPNYRKYAERTDRLIPVFLLEPVSD